MTKSLTAPHGPPFGSIFIARCDVSLVLGSRKNRLLLVLAKRDRQLAHVRDVPTFFLFSFLLTVATGFPHFSKRCLSANLPSASTDGGSFK